MNSKVVSTLECLNLKHAQKRIEITKPTISYAKKLISKNIDHCCGILIRAK